MWGTFNMADGRHDKPRFIPTHVGYIPNSALVRGSSSVHPHACGVHEGSDRDAAERERFIPTHVGYINALRCGSATGTVHPHACGVHHVNNISKLLCLGSSPRMWGTSSVSLFCSAYARFIPTHVGYILNYFATKSTKYTSLKIYQLAVTHEIDPFSSPQDPD